MKSFAELQESPNLKLGNARWADPAYINEQFAYAPGKIWLGRSPHDPDTAIGVKCESHCFVNAETRSGKGRCLMVNNQVLWPGSLIAIGPKGEEATIAAQQREAMGQDVYVLDPYGASDVPERLLAYFNPLDAVSTGSNLIADCNKIANSIVIFTGGEGDSWSREARRLIATVIAHVKTCTDPISFSPNKRDLITVRTLLAEGSKAGAALTRAAGQPLDSWQALFSEMISNPAANGVIAERAAGFLQRYEKSDRYWTSTIGVTVEQIEFLDSEPLQNILRAPEGGEGNSFSLADVKARNTSLFIHLPEDYYEPDKRWLRVMIMMLSNALKREQGKPPSGHNILFMIDEFINLGRMDEVADNFNSIAGAGVTMMIVTQRLNDLKELYGERWESFISASDCQLFFGVDGVFTQEYLEKKLGKTEVRKVAQSSNVGTSQSLAQGITETYSHAHSLSKSTTQGGSRTISQGTSGGSSISQTKGKGIASSYGSNDGYSASEGYDPHYFIRGYRHTQQLGRSGGRNKSKSQNQNVSRTSAQQSGWNRSESEGQNWSASETSSDTYTRSQARSTTETQSSSQGDTLAEQFHLKPLLPIGDCKELLWTIDETDHPMFPGLMLVLTAKALPFLVRKSYYDEDPFFIDKFTPNPAFEFIPYDQIPLRGWQVSPDHLYSLKVPPQLAHEIRLIDESGIEENQALAKSQQLVTAVSPNKIGPTVNYKAPFDLKILGVTWDQGFVDEVVLRTNERSGISEATRSKLDGFFWDRWQTIVDDKHAREALELEKQKSDKAAHLKQLQEKSAAQRKKHFWKLPVIGEVEKGDVIMYGFLGGFALYMFLMVVFPAVFFG